MTLKGGHSEPMAGNPKVVRLFDEVAAWAREGRLGWGGFIVCEAPNKYTVDFSGTAPLTAVGREGCIDLLKHIEAAIASVSLPERDPELGADYACFNVAGGPASYDFIVWLVEREMYRVRMGAPAPLKVGFFLGTTAQASGFSEPARKQFFDHVIRPALPLIGAVEDAKAIHGQTTENYLITGIVDAARAGEFVPRLRAIPGTGLASWAQGAVTITLRETISAHRNSNLPAWLKFADWLKKRGETVVFVRDTAKVMQALPGGHDDYPIASTDLATRMALYESARANLFVANGPAHLAMFMDNPFLVFTLLQKEGHPDHVNTVSFWRDTLHIEPPGQLPWCRPDQRLVWQADTFANIVDAWSTWIEPALPEKRPQLVASL